MNKNDDSVTCAMKEALRLAVEAAKAGEVPVGAVVLDGDGNIIGRAQTCASESRIRWLMLKCLL